MKFLRAISTFLFLGVAAQGCSSGSTASTAGGAEAGVLGEVQQAITTACSFDTLGLPCDPDGPANPTYLECEGVCAIGSLGLVTCLKVTTGANDGIICGTAAGVGDAACGRHCAGRACLNTPAAAGAACRPSAGATPCAGQCDGAAHCEPIAQPCDFGRDQQLCKFATCSFTAATQCQNSNLRASVPCSLADACSLGRCNAVGTCTPTQVVGCDDGNACTDDACDSATGGCIGTNDDSNTCSDSDACTTGDYCLAGQCHSGTTPKNCDDGNACTVDSCDPNTGCAHVMKSCDDGDACTDDTCDPGTGACSHQTKVCDDSSLCTTDSCNSATGCVFAPMDCDDADACTDDGCTPNTGACTHQAKVCDDSDACTTDSCDTANGCSFTPIESDACIGSGAAGAPTTGDAGAPATSGGATGDAGAPDVGAAGVPSVGGATAGSASTAGSNAVGASGGSESTGAQGGTGGTTPAPEGGQDATAGSSATHSVQSGGCGCRVPVGQTGNAGWALGLVAFMALSRRRRAA